MASKWDIGAGYVVSSNTRQQVNEEDIECLRSIDDGPQVEERGEDIGWLRLRFVDGSGVTWQQSIQNTCYDVGVWQLINTEEWQELLQHRSTFGRIEIRMGMCAQLEQLFSGTLAVALVR